MRTKHFILFFLFMFSLPAFSQQVNVKKIADLNIPSFDYYTLKYDKNTGNYIYSHYDTVTYKSTLYLNTGNIGTFDFVNFHRAVFDGNGNVYYTAGNMKNDTSYIYHLMKNDAILGTYEYLNDSWAMNNDILYFAYEKDRKYYFAELDTKSGKISSSKPYDMIFFVEYPETIYSEEQEGMPGFTKDGKPFYVAELHGKKFVVIGDKEQKSYSDIDAYSFRKDKKGQLVYIVKDKGNFMEGRGNTFIVQGNKEFNKRKYDYIYGIHGFTNENVPVYVAGDSGRSNTYPQQLVIGEKRGKLYDGGIWNVQISPKGKIVYLGSEVVDPENYIYNSFVISDGKESKKYKSVDYLLFDKNDDPVYAAQNQDDKYVIVYKGKEIYDGYNFINTMQITDDGKLIYAGQIDGDYDNKIPPKVFVHLNDNKMGPYDYLINLDVSSGQSVKVDKRGNYIFVPQKMIDWDNYVYETKAIWNGGESGTFDSMNDVGLINGKPYFTALNLKNKDLYTYNYAFYYDNKKLTDEFDYIQDFSVDEDKGQITFTGAKGKELYNISVKF